jgi:hypothetical protein
VSENEDEVIGYKKPPKTSQWKPGQSGNPKGRPKKIKDLFKLLDLELGQTVQVTINGQLQTLTKAQYIVKNIVNSAMKSDRFAQKLVISSMKSNQAIEEFELDESDREALEAFLQTPKWPEKKSSEESSNG